MQLQNLSPPPRPPEHYWNDSERAIQNIQTLTEKYPNQWIAVFNGQVIAYDADWGRVLAIIQARGIDSPVIKFIEIGIHVYKCFADFPNKFGLFAAASVF